TKVFSNHQSSRIKQADDAIAPDNTGGKDAAVKPPRKGSRRYSLGSSQGGHKHNGALFLANALSIGDEQWTRPARRDGVRIGSEYAS
ncbi:MAG: hypothetical protein ACU841_17520, partial [Gammaproteobacteria bacterium]